METLILIIILAIALISFARKRSDHKGNKGTHATPMHEEHIKQDLSRSTASSYGEDHCKEVPVTNQRCCMKCGTVLPENSKFCPNCGDNLDEPAVSFCARCGEKIVSGAKYCTKCGHQVATVAQPEESNREETTENKEPSTRRVVYDGAIHKCPSCGEMLSSFVTNCPTCGYELRSIQTNSPIEALSKKIDDAGSWEEKIDAITNFYIPNTKEDIYDFFILAASNLEGNNFDTHEAWRAKLEQAYHKAKISFGNSTEFLYIDKLYRRIIKKVSRRAVPSFFRRNKNAFLLALLATICLVITVFALTQVSDDSGMLQIAICLIVAGICLVGISGIASDAKREKQLQSKRNATNANPNVIFVRKDACEFRQKNYIDVAEQLKANGFTNIVLAAERKGLMDAEGVVISVSIAGDSDFSEYDEFDRNSRAVIHYYSKNHRKAKEINYH